MATPIPLLGILVGLCAASIGALYTVFARYGIAHGMTPWDLTFLRFAVAGPVFGLLMFGALYFAPSSHAAVFPFTAMSMMGMVMAAIFLGDRITLCKALGISIVVTGLIILAGLSAASFSARALLGDMLFMAAGTMWAGFGILLRKFRLSPLRATAVISFSALITYVPAYLLTTGMTHIAEITPTVFWIEVLVQGVIAGGGTLFTYGKMVSLLGPARAAVFPALAPGLAALIAWPVLGHIPGTAEVTGLLLAIVGLIISVTTFNLFPKFLLLNHTPKAPL